MRWTIFAVIFSLILVVPGCEQLKLPSGDTPAPEASLPPAAPNPAPNPVPAAVPPTPEQVIAGFMSKNPMEITDDDLAQLAALPTGREAITELNLKSATVSSAAFRAMSNFPALTKVDMEATRLSDPHWELISEVKSIEWLNLTRTAVNNASIEHIGALPNLTHLSLSQTVVNDDGLMTLTGLSKLSEIDISGTEAYGNGLLAFGNKGAKAPLRVIRAGNSQIGYQGFVSFKEFPTLEEVYASKSSVTDGSMEGLKGASKLRVLDVSGNSVSDEGLKNLSSSKGLEELILRDNRLVSDTTLTRLKKYPNLVKLNLEQTSCTLKGVQALKKALPNCAISFEQQTF